MRRFAVIGLAALSACSGGNDATSNQAKPVVTAAAVEPGEWEMTTEVSSATIGGKAAPMMKASKTSVKTCITPEQAKEPSPDMFAGKKGDCKYDNFYMSNGRLNASMSCSAPGGKMVMNVDGSYSGNSMETNIDMATYVTGNDDLKMTAKMTGRKVAATCSPDTAPKAG